MTRDEFLKTFVSFGDFASWLPLSRRTIEKWFADHPERLPAIHRVGTRRYVRRTDADAWLAATFPREAA